MTRLHGRRETGFKGRHWCQSDARLLWHPDVHPTPTPPVVSVPGFTHTRTHAGTSTCSTRAPSARRLRRQRLAPRCSPSPRAPPTPHPAPRGRARAHSLSAGWSCRPGGSPADRGPASAHGSCRGSATPTTTATTGACCPATGNKTSPGSTQRSESRWRWPVSCAW